MRAPTLADWMKAANPASRVFSISAKDRAAIAMVGKASDGTFWWEDVNGWTTYVPSGGVAADRLAPVARFNAALMTTWKRRPPQWRVLDPSCHRLEAVGTYGDGTLGFDDDASAAALARQRPLNLYGWSKLAFDRRVAQMLDRGAPRPPQWAGLRFFNVYGPNEAHKGRMASVLFHKFRQVMGGEAATLFRSDRPDIADGQQMRDFVHVDDCVAVMLWLLDNPQASGLFNVGSGRARSFLDLVRAMFVAMDRDPDIRFIDMPADLRGKYQYFTEAPLDRLRAAGFNGQATSLEDGVRRTVRDFLAAEDPYR